MSLTLCLTFSIFSIFFQSGWNICSIAFVAASFPLVIPLFDSLTGTSFLAYGVLAYASGFLGVLLSPVHVCFLMSRDYFCCSLSHCYGLMRWPLAMLVLGIAAYFIILS